MAAQSILKVFQQLSTVYPVSAPLPLVTLSYFCSCIFHLCIITLVERLYDCQTVIQSICSIANLHFPVVFMLWLEAATTTANTAAPHHYGNHHNECNHKHIPVLKLNNLSGCKHLDIFKTKKTFIRQFRQLCRAIKEKGC